MARRLTPLPLPTVSYAPVIHYLHRNLLPKPTPFNQPILLTIQNILLSAFEVNYSETDYPAGPTISGTIDRNVELRDFLTKGIVFGPLYSNILVRGSGGKGLLIQQ